MSHSSREINADRPLYDSAEEVMKDSIERDFGMTNKMQTFDTGATRGSDENKLDYDGFLSPLVLRRYAEYLHKHRTQADGKQRDSDNWQKGIPLRKYMKSLWRHFMDFWTLHRSSQRPSHDMQEALCGIIFNASGYLHELRREPNIPVEEICGKEKEVGRPFACEPDIPVRKAVR